MILEEIKEEVPMAHCREAELHIAVESDGTEYNSLTDPAAGENLICGVSVVKHPAEQSILNTKGNEAKRPFKL